MLLACFCLLTWLSLVGRRAYLRRNLHTRPYCSLSDLTYTSTNRQYYSRPSSRSGRARIHGITPPFNLWETRSYRSNSLHGIENVNNSNWRNFSSLVERAAAAATATVLVLVINHTDQPNRHVQAYLLNYER
ncbi:unnamed protein product [Trichobilharzia regenti]|nr:unnamed protein product [Trichobilharzia regenti]